jgi:replication factor C subunit 3/5
VSKIIPALQSRCTRFRFGPLTHDSAQGRLNEIAVLEDLKLEPDAANAIVKLSGGDMRKVLNVLESCSLAHKHISLQDVYDVTGRPSPMDMDQIFASLSQNRFNEALETLLEIKQRKSLALEDVMGELHKAIMVTKYTDEMKIYLVSRMAEIEYRLAQGSNEKVQVSSLVGAFIEVRTFRTAK